MNRHIAYSGFGGWLLVGAALILVGCSRPQVATPTPTALPKVQASAEALAEAKVVPARRATLSFRVPGTVTKVLVSEGEVVTAGQVLVRLDSAEQAAAVLQARANLAIAQADLARLQSGARDEAVAAAQAGVDQARANAQAVAGQVGQARAGLQKMAAGATAEEIAIAERQVEEAKNSLWGFQGARDAICGRAKADCDEGDALSKAACKAAREESKPGCDQAQANVQAAEERVRIAEIQLQQVRGGARAEDRSSAQAALAQTQGLYNTALAAVREAEAGLAQVVAGAATEELAAASARVDQALAALEQAAIQMDQTQLRAPFAGTVAALDARVGELAPAGTPVVQLADLANLQIRTEDLTEISVVGLAPGDPATITFDAIPDLTLPGTVQSVSQYGENRQGDIVYAVTIQPDRQDPRLRWNMTASVAIERAETAAEAP